MNYPSNISKHLFTVLLTFKAVAWSFIGIRKQSGYNSDVKQLKPIHVIFAGITLTILFVLTLILIINQVIAK